MYWKAQISGTNNVTFRYYFSVYDNSMQPITSLGKTFITTKKQHIKLETWQNNENN